MRTIKWQGKQLDGYKTFQIPGFKSDGPGRPSGGIIVGWDTKLAANVEIVNFCRFSVSLRLHGLPQMSPFIITFVYIPPDGNYKSNLNLFWESQTQIGPHDRTICLGDFNGRIGTTNPGSEPPIVRNSQDHFINERGRTLIDLLSSSGLEIGNGRIRGDESGAFTYINPTGSGRSVVDLLLYSTAVSHDIVNMNILPWSHSDHFPLAVSMKTQPLQTPIRDIITTRAKLIAPTGQQECANFSADLDVLLDSHPTSNNPQADYNALKTFVHSLCKKHKCYKKQATFSPKPKWFDRECDSLKWKKDRALRAMRRASGAAQLNSLIPTYTDLNGRYKKLCKLKREEYDRKIQLSLLNHTQSGTFWEAVRLARHKIHNPPLIAKESWYSHFSKVYASLNTYPSSSVPLHTPIGDPCLDAEISSQEIQANVRKLKNKKAPGTDMIPNEFWKSGSRKLILYLATLFTTCLNVGRVPREWGKANIIPIHKKGSTLDPANFRPIALLNTLPKLFTSILNDRLNRWVTKNKVLSDYQAGFRQGKGCLDHIFVLQALIHLKLSKGEKLYACFIDLSQAFDSPDHGKLWTVLLGYGVSTKFVRVFSYLYELAHAQIITSDGATDPIKIMRGVLKGESASPTLFNLYVEGLVERLHKESLTGLRLHVRILHILLYADDMVLLGSSQENLQAKINCAAKFFAERGLKLNLDKTKVIVFRRGGPPGKNTWFSWRGKPIKIVNKYVYLGICFSSSGSFSLACKEAVRKGLQAQGAIFSTIPRAKLLDLDLANKMFESLSRSVLLYGAALWGLPYVNEIERVQQSFYKRVLYLPINTPRYFVRLETNRAPLRANVLGAALGFWSHLLKEQNGSLVSDAYTALRADSNTTMHPKTNWCSQLKETLAITGHSYVWELNSLTVLACKRKEIIQKLQAIDREADVMSAQHSSAVPHYYDLIKGTVGCAPYLKAKLPCHLATYAATIRLGYDRFSFKGSWHKLGAIDGKPCYLCGDTATFTHIFNNCPGLTQTRILYYGSRDPNFDIQSILSKASTDSKELTKIYSYMSKVLSLLYRSADVDKPTHFVT